MGPPFMVMVIVIDRVMVIVLVIVLIIVMVIVIVKVNVIVIKSNMSYFSKEIHMSCSQHSSALDNSLFTQPPLTGQPP